MKTFNHMTGIWSQWFRFDDVRLLSQAKAEPKEGARRGVGGEPLPGAKAEFGFRDDVFG